MGGAATTKTLMQNYSALERKCDLGWGSLSCSVLRTVTPAARRGTSHPVPAAAVRTAQQSTEKCKVLRPDWQGKATGFQGGRVLHCKPLGRDACKHKLGSQLDADDCGQLQHPHFPLSPCGQAHDAQTLPPPDSVGKAPWYTLPLSAITLVRTGCPGRGTGLVPALQLPHRALPANPSPLIPLPAHVPPALCSGPNAHPA